MVLRSVLIWTRKAAFRAGFWMFLSFPLSRKILCLLFSPNSFTSKNGVRQTDSVLRLIPSTDGYFSEKTNPEASIVAFSWSSGPRACAVSLPLLNDANSSPSWAPVRCSPFRNRFNWDSAAFLTSPSGSWGDGISHVYTLHSFYNETSHFSVWLQILPLMFPPSLAWHCSGKKKMIEDLTANVVIWVSVP